MELFWFIIGLTLTAVIAFKVYDSPKAKGIRLENKIHRILEKLAVKDEGFAFKDLMLPIGISTSQNMIQSEVLNKIIQYMNLTDFLLKVFNQVLQ